MHCCTSYNYYGEKQAGRINSTCQVHRAWFCLQDNGQSKQIKRWVKKEVKLSINFPYSTRHIKNAPAKLLHIFWILCPLFFNRKLEVSAFLLDHLSARSSAIMQTTTPPSISFSHCNRLFHLFLSLYSCHSSRLTLGQQAQHSAQRHLCLDVNNRAGNPHWKVLQTLRGCKNGQVLWLRHPHTYSPTLLTYCAQMQIQINCYIK